MVKEILRFLGRKQSFEAPLAAKELVTMACELNSRSDQAFDMLKVLLSGDKSTAVYQSVLDSLSLCGRDPLLTRYTLTALEINGPKCSWERNWARNQQPAYIDIQLSDDDTKLYALRRSPIEEYSRDGDELHIIEPHSGKILQGWKTNSIGIFSFAGFYNNKPWCSAVS